MAPHVAIGDRLVGDGHPTYFIADVAANHDGDLERAKALIHLAAEAGADAAKFQNFQAARIVSDQGFQRLGAQVSHQTSVEAVGVRGVPIRIDPARLDASARRNLPRGGDRLLHLALRFRGCRQAGIVMPAIKIGSGDITWIEIIERIASKASSCCWRLEHRTSATSSGPSMRCAATPTSLC